MGVTLAGLATSGVISLVDVGLNLAKKYKVANEGTLNNAQDASRVLFLALGLISLPAVKPGSLGDEMATAAVYSSMPLVTDSLVRMAAEVLTKQKT
jgi:hypothetical protein